MLEIKNLRVKIGDVEVLKGINLHINDGETFILFGPNGSGKTTLLMTLMGFGNYTVTGGQILFKGHDITHMPMYERARLGIGMSFQRPPTIHGLKTRHMVRMCGQGREVDVDGLARKVNFENFLERDINAGFSGGEIKRSELLQLMAQQPDLVLFDEPESGVDLENMALIGKTARQLLDGVPPASCSMKEHRARCKTAGLCQRRPRTGHVQRPAVLRSPPP
jgi:Fe-S cluster assembly ATP-binding protein